MFTRALRYGGVAEERTTLINMHPGTVNTKILKAGWGACGIDVSESNDTFRLATSELYTNPGGDPKYYRHLSVTNPTE